MLMFYTKKKKYIRNTLVVSGVVSRAIGKVSHSLAYPPSINQFSCQPPILSLQMKWWNFAFPVLKGDKGESSYDHYMVLAGAQVSNFLERDDVRILSKKMEQSKV